MTSKDALPLVAVLTPVYNGEKYLAETMQCVQDSDYPKLLHVVLDNASTDRTSEIVKRFLGGRVPILTRRNPRTIPLCENMNAVAAMAPAEAKYVRLLCADDLMAPSAISRMVNIAERDDRIGIVGCQCRHGYGDLGAELPHDETVFPGTMIVRAYLRRETKVMSGTHFLFRRVAFEGRQPPYDDEVAASSDADCAIRIALGGSFGFVHEILAEYRTHSDSYSATVATTNGDHLFEWFVILDRYAPTVLSPREHAQCRTHYRRHYLRRCVVALLKHGDRRFFDRQMKRLKANDDAAHFSDFVAALLEWGYFAATGQRGRVAAPRPEILVGRR